MNKCLDNVPSFLLMGILSISGITLISCASSSSSSPSSSTITSGQATGVTTYDSAVARLGRPDSVKRLPDGKTVATWKKLEKSQPAVQTFDVSQPGRIRQVDQGGASVIRTKVTKMTFDKNGILESSEVK